MSQRGIQTQNRPHSSVIVVAISSRWQKIGQNHHHQLHGPSIGKKPRNEQSVSSTCTVAFGTPCTHAGPRLHPDDAAADAPEEQQRGVDLPAEDLVERRAIGLPGELLHRVPPVSSARYSAWR